MYGMSEARRRSGPQAANGGTELETGGFCRFNGSSKDSLAKRDMKSHKRSATGCIVPTSLSTQAHDFASRRRLHCSQVLLFIRFSCCAALSLSTTIFLYPCRYGMLNTKSLRNVSANLACLCAATARRQARQSNARIRYSLTTTQSKGSQTHS